MRKPINILDVTFKGDWEFSPKGRPSVGGPFHFKAEQTKINLYVDSIYKTEGKTTNGMFSTRYNTIHLFKTLPGGDAHGKPHFSHLVIKLRITYYADTGNLAFHVESDVYVHMFEDSYVRAGHEPALNYPFHDYVHVPFGSNRDQKIIEDCTRTEVSGHTSDMVNVIDTIYTNWFSKCKEG